jgi:hypothetical protein
MARYVVLKFEDNEKAEEFVRLNCDGNLFFHEDMDDYDRVPLGDVAALVPAPTLFCECGVRGGTKGGGFFKGPKYGWWCCAKCGKPTEAWGTSYAAVVGSGNNLLEESNVQRNQ